MAIEIRELKEGDKRTLNDFLDVVKDIYADDPCYVRPIDMEVKDRLNKRKNPFFEHADGSAWVAYQNGKAVGRITAQVDQEHLRHHKDDAGFFGFLDTINDAAIAKELLATAERWVKARGMKRLRGPLSLSINDELGCLVEGFDAPPYIMMPHHRPYQGGLIEQAGFHKLKDFYAWRYEIGQVPPRAQKAFEDVKAMPEVTTRPAELKHFDRDVRIIMDIFNDAWSDNWGFVPLTEKEMAKLASDMKPALIPELTKITMINGEPVAVALAVPNINEMIQDLNGKIFPFGLVKLLYRLKVKGPRSGRLIILGIKKQFRNVRRYGGLSAFLYVEMNRSAHLLGLKEGELSWTVEDNAAINVGIKLMGGRIYKRYRVYEREI